MRALRGAATAKEGCKVRIAICDDDRSALSHAASLVRSWAKDRDDLIVESFTEGDSLLASHEANSYDVILLDIVMPGLSGIEVAREIRSADSAVKLVFLTSSPEFALESYSVKAANYLLKPIDPTALFACLDEIHQELACSRKARTLLVKGARSVHRVSLDSVEFVEARGKHVSIALAGSESLESIEPLHSFEGKLFIDDGFFKCHRSYIVNIHHVSTYTPDEVVMRSGVRIPISRGCKADFKEAYFSVIFADEDWGLR